MPINWTQVQPADLLHLAQAQFGSLSMAESTLLAAAQTGGLAVCGANVNLDDLSNDPARAHEWEPKRNIRATLIRWLCVNRSARDKVSLNGIQLIGAKIIGELDLTYITAPFGLSLLGCRLIDSANLYSANVAELDLRGSWVPSLSADCITVTRRVLLSDGFRADGEVRLAAAQIGIDLVCENGVFSNPTGVALNIDGANVRRNVFLHKRFRAEGQVRLSGTHIGGSLECDGATIRNSAKPDLPESGISFQADRITVGGYIFLRNGFSAEGEVRLLNAEIGSNLECEGALLENPPKNEVPHSGMALNAEGIQVKGNLILANGFRARGEVRLRGANIGGNLNCDKGAFINPSKMALDADRAKVAGYVLLRNGFSAEGEVKLLNAEIGSNLECDTGKFKNPPQYEAVGSGKAITADSIWVGGYVFLRNGFSAEGKVNFLNAQIGSDVECDKSTFRNPTQKDLQETGTAFCLDGANVEGSVFLGEDFDAQGEVSLCRAHIGGHLTCVKARVEGRFIAQASDVAGGFFWTTIAQPELTQLDIVMSKLGALVDDRPSWPVKGKLRIDGLVYEQFSSSSQTPKSAKARLDWLSRQEVFAPQPYRQVAKILKNNGDNVGARRVLREMEHVRRKHEYAARNWFVRSWAATWSTILRVTIGYGFHPARALWCLVGLTVLGTILFRAGYAAGSIAPTQGDAYREFEESGIVPGQYERFNPLIYSLENSFPLIRFGQSDHWQAAFGAKWQYTRSRWLPRSLGWLVSPWSLRRIRWLQISLGWFFTTMGVAAVTGIVRKE